MRRRFAHVHTFLKTSLQEVIGGRKFKGLSWNYPLIEQLPEKVHCGSGGREGCSILLKPLFGTIFCYRTSTIIDHIPMSSNWQIVTVIDFEGARPDNFLRGRTTPNRTLDREQLALINYPWIFGTPELTVLFIFYSDGNELHLTRLIDEKMYYILRRILANRKISVQFVVHRFQFLDQLYFVWRHFKLFKKF